jgi:hypothetical protein
MNLQTITPQRTAELWAIRRTEWSATEYMLLAQRYVDTAKRMKIAVEEENFAGLRSAHLDLTEIVDQTAFLNGGLQKAIESVSNRSTKP